MKTFLSLLFAVVLCTATYGQNYDVDKPPVRPDAKMTPGDALPVTVEQLSVKGYANINGGGVRNVPESLKRQVFIAYFGKVPEHPGDFEIDHLVSLEIGGSNSIKNLWPQSYLTQPYNSHVKDRLEDHAAALVRHALKEQGHDAATRLLGQIQKDIATDWIAAYRKYVGPLP